MRVSLKHLALGSRGQEGRFYLFFSVIQLDIEPVHIGIGEVAAHVVVWLPIALLQTVCGAVPGKLLLPALQSLPRIGWALQLALRELVREHRLQGQLFPEGVVQISLVGFGAPLVAGRLDDIVG